MFGLNQIRSINENETRRRRDAERQKRGQKPADAASKILRGSVKGVRFRTAKSVVIQGREVSLN